MPLKKNAGGQKTAPQEVQVLPDAGDPALVAMAIIDKKKRNLEKRKNKLESLRDELESGTNLDKDQLAAVAKINEVNLQLDLVKELQKQFTSLQSDYQKSRKKTLKVERQAARESERDSEKRAVTYTVRLQDILNSMGDQDKENFKNGTNGAVPLTDAELVQLDELFGIITPARQGNPNYSTEVNTAGECIQQLLEQSSKEVLGTTYKQMYDLIQRIDSCGYFDRAPTDNEDEESQEEGVADEDDYKSAEDNLTTDGYDETQPPVIGDYIPPPVHVEQPMLSPQPQQPPSPVVQSPIMISFVPSAPSPTFPGLGPSPLQPTVDTPFSFMHESEVDRGAIQAIQQRAPATLEGTLLSGSSGDLGPTDVNTGQPHQSSANTYQSPFLNSAAAMGLSPSNPQFAPSNPQFAPNADLNSAAAMGFDPSAGLEQFGATVHLSSSRGGARNGGGNRRGPGGPKNGGGGAMYRNGRGGVGVYEEQLTAGYNNRAAYSGGGSGGYQQRGGRPNYRTANTGNRK